MRPFHLVVLLGILVAGALAPQAYGAGEVLVPTDDSDKDAPNLGLMPSSCSSSTGSCAAPSPSAVAPLSTTAKILPSMPAPLSTPATSTSMSQLELPQNIQMAI